MIKRRILTALTGLIIALMVIVPGTLSEAHGTTSLEVTGGDEVSKGEEFTIHIVFAGDDTARVEGQVGYDNSMLEYISGGSNDGSMGFVELKKSQGDGQVTFDITFKALNSGNTGIDISSSEIYDYNKNPLDECAYSKIVSIKPATVDGSEETKANDDVVKETSTQSVAYDEENAESSSLPNMMILLIAVVAVVLIAVILVIAISKKKKDKNGKSSKSR